MAGSETQEETEVYRGRNFPEKLHEGVDAEEAEQGGSF